VVIRADAEEGDRVKVTTRLWSGQGILPPAGPHRLHLPHWYGL